MNAAVMIEELERRVVAIPDARHGYIIWITIFTLVALVILAAMDYFLQENK